MDNKTYNERSPDIYFPFDIDIWEQALLIVECQTKLFLDNLGLITTTSPFSDTAGSVSGT